MTSGTEAVDFLVVGSGSGLDVANAVANQDQSVAVVEKDPLGGTCLNRGCIPSKRLLYHATVRQTIDRAEAFGIHADVTGVDFAEIVREVNDDVSGSAESIRRGLRSSNRHTLFEGMGQFVDDHTIELVEGRDAGERVRAETILLAAGSRPSIPDIEGIEDVPYLTSREGLQLESPPGHLVIIGGGYIGAELAHFFGTFGSDVTIVGRRPRLLPHADEPVGISFTERYRERFDVHVGYEAVTVSGDDDAVTVEARPYPPAWDDISELDDVTVTGDTLLVAAGRRPNSDTLELDVPGVETDEQGFIETDEYLRTTADDVWALGDIVGEYLLKHNANHEARTVVGNVLGDDLDPIDYTAIPYAVFASPEVAGVGTTEQALVAADREYATTTYDYADTARGMAMNAQGFVRVLIDPDGTILGCHIVGPGASSLIQEVVVAMKAGSGTVHDIRESVHIHPALPEVVDRAFSSQFVLAGEHEGVHHHDHGTGRDHDDERGHTGHG
ncbi:dihydrolipoamide dehydrogenase [Halovivax asiaticus JCM 14624]|uniref:Dihydrolipoamide dehydrogenase n=1 Tax=Halovivax asiaticus JCM 14624 TaxID=1227490 RepID=M0BIK1_9EURY|nr:dihydrolipoyl dehydrogenase [Halovivax asiaticus]ELZ10716.1 dihydrolipoamide dehydrogenase [Halovivax asiaticus JCM 14624]